MTVLSLVLYAAASFIAGITNTLAGGGSFLTFPSLLFTGLDPRAANITSTIALFPMQVSTGYAGRGLAGGTAELSLRILFIISILGGVFGALLLLLTPPAFFAKLVPWLILFATGVFAYSSFYKKPDHVDHATDKPPRSGKHAAMLGQLAISIYGGYFGGGIGFLMLASLSWAGMAIRKAGATKNILAAAMNAAAVIIFLFSKDVGWAQAGLGMVFSVLGGFVGIRLLTRVNERLLRLFVVGVGVLLTIAMFLYTP